MILFTKKENEFVNLALVKKFELNKNVITFYFNLETEDYTEFIFKNEEEAEKYLNTTILPLLMRALPK